MTKFHDKIYHGIARLWHARTLFASLFMILAFYTTPAHGSTILDVGLDEMLRKAEFVFEGEVINVVARETESGASVHTYVTFRILETIKGQYLQDTIELRFLGGEVGDLTVTVSEMHFPALGEKGIYFVESLSRHQINPLLGWSQGHILVVSDETGIERVLSRDRRPIISVESEDTQKGSALKVRSFSKGVARGLVVGEGGEVAKGLPAMEFKKQLRKKLGMQE